MTALPLLLAVTLLGEAPTAETRAARAKAVSEDADRVYAEQQPRPEEKPTSGIRIRSVRSDFDRRAGVAVFEGRVVVDYDKSCTMASDRLFVFLAGTNRLNRIVATGHVAITNGQRTGSCETAEFSRRANEIVMYGNGAGVRARLCDAASGDEIAGSSVRFWLDSEQTEVADSTISVRAAGGEGGLK